MLIKLVNEMVERRAGTALHFLKEIRFSCTISAKKSFDVAASIISFSPLDDCHHISIKVLLMKI